MPLAQNNLHSTETHPRVAGLPPALSREKVDSADGLFLWAWLMVAACLSHLQGMVEKWLQQVEQVMLVSMREVIRLGIEAYVQVNKNWVHVPGCWYSNKNFGGVK